MILVGRWRLPFLIVLSVILGMLPHAASAPVKPKRIAFIVDSWYPRSHADVIGKRFLEGYRVGGQVHSSPLTVASVYSDAPYAEDQTRVLATRYGFRVAASVAEALLEDPRNPSPRLAVDGVFISTREDIPGSGQRQSPNRRLQVVREVLRILEQTSTRVPLFIDKMLAGEWSDSQAIVSEAARRGIPLMGGSVLPYVPLDRPVRTGRVEVGVVIASTPYWAFAFHAAELLQGFMEQRGSRETGVSEIREAGPAYWSLPDRNRWGGRVFDALLASARTRSGSMPSLPSDFGDGRILLIQYVDGARAVLALIPRAFDDSEFLLGAQYSDGTISTGGLVLPGDPFDHFGYLVQALVELYTTGHPPIPAERTLLTTGIVLVGLRAPSAPVSSPSLAISYPVSRTRP
jgi:hypothetical protein